MKEPAVIQKHPSITQSGEAIFNHRVGLVSDLELTAEIRDSAEVIRAP